MIDYISKFRLDNKITYVIGGNGLIGSKIVDAFLSCGSNIICLDKHNKRKMSKKNNYKFVKFDVSMTNNIEKKYINILKKNGHPNIFINCSYPYTSDWIKNNFKEIKYNSYKKNIDLHLNTYAWFAKLTADYMQKNKIKGSIIQLGSIYGILGQDMNIYKNTNMKENMTYSVIKGGIINLTKQMASYYGKYNIRINTLSPGAIEGPVSGLSKNQNKNFITNYSKKNPLKRLGKAEEVAMAALFLASDASTYVTGTNLIVDGGWTAI